MKKNKLLNLSPHHALLPKEFASNLGESLVFKIWAILQSQIRDWGTIALFFEKKNVYVKPNLKN